MKTLVLPLAAFACLLLSGCEVPSSIHPLYNDQDAVTEPALEGTWINPDKPDDPPIVFKKSGDYAYTMSGSAMVDKNLVQTFDVHLVRLGNGLYLDLSFSKQTIGEDDLDLPLGAIPTHEIVKLQLNGDDLAYATLKEPAIKEQNQWTSLPLPLIDSDGVSLTTASTADLRSYISTHPTEIFDDYEHLERKPTPQP